MKLTFWGAAKTVTGSLHMIETAGRRFILDCGLYQGRRAEAKDRNTNLPFEPSQLDGVVLSHAHIDHSGNLPTLVRRGYKGPIYTARATADLCEAMLKDSAFVQEKDCEFLNKRRRRRQMLGSDIEPDGPRLDCPLYTVEDAEGVMPLFREMKMHQQVDIGGLKVRFQEAGHMLGSASMVLEAGGLKLGFSGDLGRPRLPIIRDPEPMPQVDYLILESTYGDRLHKPLDAVEQKLADAVSRTAARGGRIVCPAFAVGRTQQLVLMLHELVEKRKIPNIPVFVDSPLAVNVTDIYRKHADLFDEETRRFPGNGPDPFGFKMLRHARLGGASEAFEHPRAPELGVSGGGEAAARHLP